MVRFKFIVSIFLLTCVVYTGSSQVNTQPSYNRISIKAGLRNSTVKDNRLSAIAFKNRIPTFGIEMEKVREDSRQIFSFQFSGKFKTNNELLLDIKTIQPVFSYSFEKKVNNLWIGGYFGGNTLLVFPKSKTGHFNNTPISYTIAHSIGPKLSWSNVVNQDASNKMEIRSSIETPLLSYVIRPAYGHPYPEKYLESGTFSPTRSGMAGPLLRSGKLMSIGKFQSINVKVGISYFISDRFILGADLVFDYARVTDINTSHFANQDLLLSFSYQY